VPQIVFFSGAVALVVVVVVFSGVALVATSFVMAASGVVFFLAGCAAYLVPNF